MCTLYSIVYARCCLLVVKVIFFICNKIGPVFRVKLVVSVGFSQAISQAILSLGGFCPASGDDGSNIIDDKAHYLCECSTHNSKRAVLRPQF